MRLKSAALAALMRVVLVAFNTEIRDWMQVISHSDNVVKLDTDQYADL